MSGLHRCARFCRGALIAGKRALKRRRKRVKKRWNSVRAMLALRVRWWKAFARLDESARRDRRAHSVSELSKYCDVVYINLDHRIDRRTQVEEELQRVGLGHARRLSAVKTSPGIIGCAQSHGEALTSWSANYDHLLIVCEDDCQFIAPSATLHDVIAEFARNPLLDVLAIANNTRWSVPVSARLAVSADVQTTSCYCIKSRAVADLVVCARDSVRRLRSGEAPKTAAIDMVWKSMQQKRFFAVPRERIAIQRAGHSDIENQWVNYGL